MPNSEQASAPPAPPTGVNHYNVFASVLALIYMGIILLGFYIVFQNPFGDSASANKMEVNGIIMIILSVPMCIASAASLFFPAKKWAWIAHIIIAAITTSSCCMAPFGIYIIAKYLDPEVKRYFDI